MLRRLGLAAFLSVVLASTALAAPGDAERRAISAHDQAWARRINLTLRDLPSGFRQGAAANEGNSGGLTCPGYSPDLSRFTITGEASSRQFASASGSSIFSSAEIFRSAADERGDWALTARREALACLRRQLQEAVGTAAKVTAAVRPAPRLGERSISFRATLSVAANGVRATVWLDVLGVARGRGDAALVAMSVRTPPSAALEQSLLAKLASRLSG
jgi:hypothetical protein